MVIRKTLRILFLVINLFSCGRAFDVNLIGYLSDIRSISRHTSSFARCLQGHCSLKLFKTRACNKKSFSIFEKTLIDDGISLQDQKKLNQSINEGLTLSGVTIYTDSYFKKDGVWNDYLTIPNSSTLKFAYVVVENTKISQDEVNILNQHFDALIVPDQWLEPVYRKSGVTLPIFTLPLALDLQSLLNKPVKKASLSNFVFGFSGVNPHRKNVQLLIKAFSEEFKDNSHVSLIIHTRFERGFAHIQEMLNKDNYKNIQFLQKGLSRVEYEDFLSNLSCYVLLSKGEGFSITPREALAAGIPCVISDNTAHKSICDSGCVAAVRSDIREPVYKRNKKIGCMFNCTVSDARKVLRDVYQRYDHYWECAQQGRAWTKQYLVENLQAKYLTLIKPSRLILGHENKITDDYLMVNSQTLFNKYKRLCGSFGTVFEEMLVAHKTNKLD